MPAATDQLAHPLRRLRHDRFGLFHRLSAHDLLDAEPLLEIAFGNHEQENQASIRILGATAGVMDGFFAFRRAVDDRHEFATMPFKPRKPF